MRDDRTDAGGERKRRKRPARPWPETRQMILNDLHLAAGPLPLPEFHAYYGSREGTVSGLRRMAEAGEVELVDWGVSIKGQGKPPLVVMLPGTEVKRNQRRHELVVSLVLKAIGLP